MSIPTPRNVSELERILDSYTEQSNNTIKENTPTKMDLDNDESTESLMSKLGLGNNNAGAGLGKSHQMGTGQLIRALGEYQCATNSKLDMLARLYMEQINLSRDLVQEQKRTNDLLTVSVRNSISNGMSQPVVQQSSGTKVSKLSLGSCKDYGLDTNSLVISEFIRVIIDKAIASFTDPRHRYPTSVPLDRARINRLVKALMSNDIIEGDVTYPKLIPPKTRDHECVYLASKLGLKNGVPPMISVDVIRQIFNDTECRAMVSATVTAIKGLKKLRILLPHYESDIINALGDEPYFNEDGEVKFDPKKLVKRSEKSIESMAVRSKPTTTVTIAADILRGKDPEQAVRDAHKGP